MARQYQRTKNSNLTSITAWHDFARNRLMFLFLALLFGVGIVAYFGTGPGGGSGSSSSNRANRAQDVVAVVNGEKITRVQAENALEKARLQARMEARYYGGGAMGEAQKASTEGRQLGNLVDSAIMLAAAKKQGLTVSDADVDKEIADLKKQGGQGKPLTDEQFSAMLAEQGTSEDQIRTELKESLLPKILDESIANKTKVTEADLLKNYDEVKVRHILIASGPGKMPDAQAKTRAEKVLAEVKAGKDFATLANEYTDDPGNKPTKWDPKLKKQVPGEPQGGLYDWAPASKYAKEFGDAALALKPGEVTPEPVKTQFGYHIIKLEGKRQKLPADYAKNKAKLLEDLKQQKAQPLVSQFLEEQKKTAKIEWRDPALKWKYDYGKMGGAMGMMPMGGQGQMDEKSFLSELQSYVAKNPDDAEANLILGQMLDKQYMMAGINFNMGGKKGPAPVPPAERDKMRAELIAAYDNALKHTEDQQTRFRLAELYEEDKQPAKALEVYKRIQGLLKWDDSPAGTTMHSRLAAAFTKLGDSADAQAEQKKVAELTAKEAAERKAQAAKSAAAPPTAPGGTIKLAPGKSSAVTINTPSAKKPEATSKAPAPKQ